MDKEKEIEEMAKTIVNFKEKHSIPLGVGFHSVDLSKHIIEAGYRKADEVRKETIREILYAVDDEARGTTSEVTRVLRRRYGVEVDE